MSRLENCLAWAIAGVFVAGSLIEHQPMGAVGDLASTAMRTVVGNAAWLIPLWMFDAARRTFAGYQLIWRRVFIWLLLVGLVAVSFGMVSFAAGGRFGGGLAALLLQRLGAGATLIVLGTWTVIGLRLIGAAAADRIAESATRVVVSCRPSFANRLSLLSLPAVGHLDPIDAVGESVSMQHASMGMSMPPVVPTTSSAATRAVVVAKVSPLSSSSWSIPSTELLLRGEHAERDIAFLNEVAKDLTTRLGHFRIAASVAPAKTQGAIVSRYEVSPAATQAQNAITARAKDLSASYKGLLFVPMEGTGKLGIEIPLLDSHRRTIPLRDVVDSSAWTDADAILPLALGVTTAGDPVVIDLAECPHLLVAGSTGAGKSVAINAMLTSLLLRNSPSEMRLILIDPKVVEFPRYRGLPHLLTPVITETQEAIDRLAWACEEMDRRYQRFAVADAENLVAYNETAERSERMPRIVIVIDEYADLTCVAARDPENPERMLSVARTKEMVEGSVIRLAQKARAAGIHLVLATQRPSVDVVTGAIKANFPSRISFKTAQGQDSTTIIGQRGAEKLLGNGDSYCLIPSLSADLTRVHGAFVSKTEVRSVVAAWISQTEEQPVKKVSPTPAETSEPKLGPPKLPEPESEPESLDSHPLARPPIRPVSSLVSRRADEDRRYERAIGLARERGCISMRVLSEELGCGNVIAKRLFARLLADSLVEPGGTNNTHRFCGDEAAERNDT